MSGGVEGGEGYGEENGFWVNRPHKYLVKISRSQYLDIIPVSYFIYGVPWRSNAFGLHLLTLVVWLAGPKLSVLSVLKCRNT